MAIAEDAFTADNITSGNHSFTHTPSGTPDGVIVGLAIRTNLYTVTSVSYGGTALSEVTNSPISRNAGETGTAAMYLLGSSVPSGAQTVAVNYSATGFNRSAGCWTVTAGGGTVEEVNSHSFEGTGSSISNSLALSSETSFVCLAAFTGENAVTSCTPLSGWTDDNEYDMGSQCGFHYSYDTIGSADVNTGFTIVSDEYAYVAGAFKEVSAGGGLSIPVAMNSYRQHNQLSFG